MWSLPPAISCSGRCLPLALAWCALGFGVAADVSRADGEGAPAAPPADSNSSTQTIAVTPVLKSEKPVVLPPFEVSALRERLDAREKIIEKDTQFWAGFMRLDNGVLIDNTLFASKYMAAHPNEIVRLVGLQVGLAGHHEGVGDLATGRKLDCFLVYTSGDELHARDVRYGDRVYPDFKASQIHTLSDKTLLRNTEEFLEITHGVAAPNGPAALAFDRSIHDHEIPLSVSGDDPNLQVRYAEAKLKEIGMTTFVVPATESTGPHNNLMLIFGTGHTFFVWRPYFGGYHLAKDAYAKFGIREVADANAK